MAKIHEEEHFTFDDILIKPKYSNIKTRSDVDVSLNINGVRYSNPIIPANMKTILSKEFLLECASNKSMAFMHRFSSIENQVSLLKEIYSDNENKKYIGVSVGVKEEDKENSKLLYEIGCRLFLIDIAHGHSEACGLMCKYLKSNFKDILVVAGNVASKEGAKFLWDNGADLVKVGIGSGGICTTRINAGSGVPQISALKDVDDFKRSNPFYSGKLVVSDGGHKSSGDVAKALGFADMVMLGSLYSGCKETPGTIIHIDGIDYKEYTGSSTYRDKHIEGVSALVHVKNKTYKQITEEIIQGVKSACSYSGAKDLSVFKEVVEFVKITGSSIKESNVHSVAKII